MNERTYSPLAAAFLLRQTRPPLAVLLGELDHFT
jgi:hypothetical protein